MTFFWSFKMENQLFIIPIYLRSPKEYDSEMRKKEKNGAVAFGKIYELNWPPWQYNDIIGYFEICVNSHKIISVIKYWKDCKRINRNPLAKQKGIINMDNDFILTTAYQELSEYFDNQELELKNRVLKILEKLDKIVKKENHFIDTAYHKNLLENLDIENFIVSMDYNNTL